MGSTNFSFFAGFVVSKTVKSLIFGLLFFWLSYVWVVHFIDPKTVDTDLFGYVVWVLLFSSASICLGIAISRIVTPLIIWPLKGLHKWSASKVENLNSSDHWPGRRILEELRSIKNSRIRRNFLAFGLDSKVPVSINGDALRQDFVERLLDHLLAIESILLEKGDFGLAHSVNSARKYTFRNFRFSRLIVVVENSTSFILPLVVLVLCTGSVSELAQYTQLSVESVGNIGTLLGHLVSTLSTIKGVVSPFAMVVAIPAVIYFVGNLIFLISWGVAQSTETKADDIIALSVSWLIAGIVGIVLMLKALSVSSTFPESINSLVKTIHLLVAPIIYSGESLKGTYLEGLGIGELFIVKAVLVAWITFVLIVLLRTSCNTLFKRFTSKTLQKQDDLAVEIARIFGTFILSAIGIGWIIVTFLTHYQGTATVDSAGGALMPYAILVAVAGSILGIGSKDLLENFFAGVSLQIDRPFELGERIILPSGELCEVRSIGMRSTHFFDISDNADLYVPNTELARQTVRNLSRPDRQYRRSITYQVAAEPFNSTISDRNILEISEGVMLLAAYSIEGIDVPTIVDQELEESTFFKSRSSIITEYQRIQSRFDELTNAQFKFEGVFQSVGDVIENNAQIASQGIRRVNNARKERWNRQAAVPADTKFTDEELKELAREARAVGYAIFKLATCFYSVGATYPGIKSDLEPVILEILRAPVVRSSHKITENGNSFWEIELLAYAQLTEQSDDIIHHLNLLVNNYLGQLGLRPKLGDRNLKDVEHD